MFIEKQIEEIATRAANNEFRRLWEEYQSSLIRIPKTSDIGGIEIAKEITGLARQTIYQLVSARKIPHKKIGKRLYFSRIELLNFIEEGKRLTLDEIREEAEKYLGNKKSLSL